MRHLIVCGKINNMKRLDVLMLKFQEGTAMKFYLKVFLIAFIGFIILFTGVLFALDAIYASNDVKTPVVDASTEPIELATDSGDPEDTEYDERTELLKIAEASSRINILAFGLNEQLADTMMLFSYNPENNHMDVLSIPRDTYHHIEGYNDPAQKKMNAVYGFAEIGGVNGMKQQLSEFLGVPIHYYLKVDFKAVEAVVNTLGGYAVTVPFDMDYDDKYDNPPLHIHFKKGYQVLNGADTVKYLRFRKNNSGTIIEGDVHRIPRQQHFVNAMISQALSSKLPSVINTIIGGNYVKTDMTIEEALGLAIKAASMQTDDITYHMLEGEAKMINGASYWIHDPNKLEILLYKFYGFDLNEDGTVEETTDENGTEPSTGN